MQEESISFRLAKNVFYNPEMQFCRSFCSLAVGAIDGDISLLDAFSASGIRGIRYKKENKNVASIDFLEANDDAIPLLEKNLKKNKIRAGIIQKLYEKHFTCDFFLYDFIEIDPFGTPMPYLWSTFYGQLKQKKFYLSVTATDVAVLCGPEAKACMKNYHSKSLNNEFTHENGTRILVRRVMESANEFYFGVTPLFSLSDRHYIKVLLKIEKGAKKADENLENVGHISYCDRCGWRTAGKRMQNRCKLCDEKTNYTGPLWLGELHDKKFLEKMLKINAKRNYAHRDEIEKVLKMMLGEIGMPPGYYNVHELSKKLKTNPPRLEKIIEGLKKLGYGAARTHFSSTAIKTGASLVDISKMIRK